MQYDNVKLWFARNEGNLIVTIDEITKENRTNTYSCPICGSNVRPKAIFTEVASHFAHVDAMKCSSEHMIHWWFKNKFIEKGDSFTIISDKSRMYVCSEIQIERSYETGSGLYKPDVTVKTECGNTMYFEMNYSNKKKVKDYLDNWLHLNNIVVEVDVKKLIVKDVIPTFKALFYSGKCFNLQRNDTYYNTIGKYKEEKLSGEITQGIKERIQKLDWFWDDVQRYNKNELDIATISTYINEVNWNEKVVVDQILKKSICSKLFKDYKNYIRLDDLATFDRIPEVEHTIYKLHERIITNINKFNKDITVDLSLQECMKSESYYNGSRKHPYKYRRVFSHYVYNIKLKYKNKMLKNIEVTNRILQIADLQLNKYLFDLKKELSSLKTKKHCTDCDKGYFMTIAEINFYIDKKLHLPKRCKKCRALKNKPRM